MGDDDKDDDNDEICWRLYMIHNYYNYYVIIIYNYSSSLL